MQEFLVSLILAAAVWILWKQMAPRPLRLFANGVSMRIARAMGWKDASKKLAATRRKMTAESACALCAGCSPRQQTGCERRLRPEDIKKHRP